MLLLAHAVNLSAPADADHTDAAALHPLALHFRAAFHTATDEGLLLRHRHLCACGAPRGEGGRLRCEPARFGADVAHASAATEQRHDGSASDNDSGGDGAMVGSLASALADNKNAPLPGLAAVLGAPLYLAGVALDNASSGDDDDGAFEQRVLSTNGCKLLPRAARPWRGARPWISLVARGACGFTQKALVAEMMGASAIIVMDSQPSYADANGRSSSAVMPTATVTEAATSGGDSARRAALAAAEQVAAAALFEEQEERVARGELESAFSTGADGKVCDGVAPGLPAMKDGGRLAGSQPRHVDIRGRMVPLSLAVVAVSRAEGLRLARQLRRMVRERGAAAGDVKCLVGYGGGWRAAREALRLRTRLMSLTRHGTTRAAAAWTMLRYGEALRRLSAIEVSAPRAAHLAHDAIVAFTSALPELVGGVNDGASGGHASAPENVEWSAARRGLDALEELLADQDRRSIGAGGSAASAAPNDAATILPSLRKKVAAELGIFVEDVIHGSAARGNSSSDDGALGLTRLQNLLPRAAGVRLLKLATQSGSFERIGCDSAEGSAGGAWADWSGVSLPDQRNNDDATAKCDERTSSQHVMMLPRGSHLDAVANEMRARGNGATDAMQSSWDWTWGWSMNLQRGGKQDAEVVDPSLMREAMRRGSDSSKNVERQQREAQEELRWLVGRLEQRIAAMLGVPRGHIEHTALVKIGGGALDLATARSDGFHDGVSNAAQARCAPDAAVRGNASSFSEKIFQETVGGARTLSLHLFLTDACSVFCHNSSSCAAKAACETGDNYSGLMFPLLNDTSNSNLIGSPLRFNARAGTALMWQSMRVPRKCMLQPQQCYDTTRWEVLRNSMYIDEPVPSSDSVRFVLRVRVRAREATKARAPKKEDERAFLRNYDRLMTAAISGRRPDERLTESDAAVTKMAICVGITTRQIAGIQQHVVELQKLQFRAVKIADAHDTRILSDGMARSIPSEAAAEAVLADYKHAAQAVLKELPLFKLLLPSVVQTTELDAHNSKVHQFSFRLYAVYDKGDPLLDIDLEAKARGGNRSDCGPLGKLARSVMRDTSAAMLREAFDAPGKRAAVLLRFDGGALAPKKPGPAFNFVTGAAHADGADLLVRVNDDTIFMHAKSNLSRKDGALDWPTAVANAFLAFPVPEPHLGVAGPHCVAGNDAVLTHDATHRTHMNVFGHYYPPILSDWWMDDWISLVYGPTRTIRAPGDWEVVHHTSNQGTRYNVDHTHRLALKHELRRGAARLQRWLEGREQLAAHQKRVHDASCTAQMQARQRWIERIAQDGASVAKNKSGFNASVKADIMANARLSERVVEFERLNDRNIVKAATSTPRANVQPRTDGVGACSSENGELLKAAGVYATFVLHHTTLATRRKPMQWHLKQRCFMENNIVQSLAESNHSSPVTWITEHDVQAEFGDLLKGNTLQDPLRFLRPGEPLLSLKEETGEWSRAWANVRTFYPQQLLETEISIAEKHILAWQRVAQLEAVPEDVEPAALILEDDALLGENFRALLAHYMSQMPKRWGLLSLGGTLGMHVSAAEVRSTESERNVFRRTPLDMRESSSKSRGVLEATYTLSDHNMFRSPDAYVLTRTAARTLLRTIFPLAFAIDAHLNVLLNALALRQLLGQDTDNETSSYAPFSVWWAEPTLAVQAAGDAFHDVALGRSGFAFESSLLPQREERAALSEAPSAAVAAGAADLAMGREPPSPAWKYVMRREQLLRSALALDAGHAHVDQTHEWLAEVAIWQAKAAELAAQVNPEARQDTRTKQALARFRCMKWRSAIASYETVLAALSTRQGTAKRRLRSLHHNFAVALTTSASADCTNADKVALSSKAATHFRAAIAAWPALLSSRVGLAATLRATRGSARDGRAQAAEAQKELRHVWDRLTSPIRAPSAAGGKKSGEEGGQCAGRESEGESAGRGDEEQLSVANVGGMLGALLLEGGSHAEAERIFESVAARAPRDMASWLNLGVARQESGKLAEARVAFERAQELAPANATVERALRQLMAKTRH